MNHVLSASIQEALTKCIVNDDTPAIADAFVEMYALAQVGMSDEAFARGVDEMVYDILTHTVEL